MSLEVQVVEDPPGLQPGEHHPVRSGLLGQVPVFLGQETLESYRDPRLVRPDSQRDVRRQQHSISAHRIFLVGFTSLCRHGAARNRDSGTRLVSSDTYLNAPFFYRRGLVARICWPSASSDRVVA
jgi:hypothetical protein